ncbi:hypothetical protein WA158_003148 [Blastocystis sp. Blastoise]
MLWVDTYKPKTLDAMTFHKDLSNNLKKMAMSENIPHILFYGPSGAGKKTRISAFIREIYGSGTEKIRLEHKEFKNNSGKTIEITTLASNYHIELNPSDAGLNDCLVIQEVIKEIAQFKQIDANAKHSFKIVVLNEVDNLSRNAQAALRRTMEKYTSSCRLILCCENPGRVIDPVKSRCLNIRLSAPSNQEVVNVLNEVSRYERVTLPPVLATRIAQASHRNIRRAILTLETLSKVRNPLDNNMDIPLMDWEQYILTMATEIVQEQSPQCLLKQREKLYDLLGNCIPANIIIKQLMKELLKKCGDEDLKVDAVYWAAYYDHRLREANKEIIHIEAFIAKFMALYKAFLMTLY